MLSNEILLLKIIASNGRISLLRERGLSHSQVATMIKEQEKEGNVIITERDISLTNKGKSVLDENISKISTRKKDQWILPQEHLYNTPISLNEIVLPKNKKILY